MHVAIVGAGIAGLSTAWALTRAGHRVTLLEQAAQIPNPVGASGDQHRIIRRGYGEADGYAMLLTEAYEAWDRLWDDLGAQHYVETGVLNLCQRDGDEADVIRQGFDRLGIGYERLAPGPAAERFRFLDPDGFAYATVNREGGALLCQRIAASLVGWLRARGAVLRADTRVIGIDPARATLRTEAGDTVAADRLVVTGGGWTTKLLPALAPTLETRRTHVVYAEPPADLRDAWARAPVLLSVGGDAEAWGIPPVAGTGLKFGSGLMQHRADPDAGEPGDEARGRAILDLLAPPLARVADYGVAGVRACVYTFTRDDCFFSAQADRATVVSACSGHGYKFGAAVGLNVAQAVLDGDARRLERWLRAELASPAAAARATGDAYAV